jgi:hypothetical protein
VKFKYTLNGLQFDDFGDYCPCKRPFPGSNLFSLASGGAIFIRDPEHKTVGERFNGGQSNPLADPDVNLGMIDSVSGKKRKKGAAATSQGFFSPHLSLAERLSLTLIVRSISRSSGFLTAILCEPMPG